MRLRNDCDWFGKQYNLLEEDINLKNRVKKGNKALEVKIACKKPDNNCDYVLKVIEFNEKRHREFGGPLTAFDSIRELWLNELEVSVYLNEMYPNTVPDIINAWYCIESNGNCRFNILMEKFDGDLEDFFQNVKITPKIKEQMKDRFEDLYNILVNDIHKEICTGDIKEANFLYKKVKGGYHFVLADFGVSEHKGIDEEKYKRCISNEIRRFKQILDKINDLTIE